MFRHIFRGAAEKLVVSANLAVIFMGSTLVTPLYPVYEHRFKFAELTVTLIYASYVIGNLAALCLLGRLSDQIGRRRVTFPAIGLACISTLVYLCASGTGWLFAGRILSGLAIGSASGTYTAWIAELTEGRDKSGASVMAATANMLGLAMGPLMGGILARYAPAPLHLSFAVYVGLLFMTGSFLKLVGETVKNPVTERSRISLKPRFGVPREIRAAFFVPAVTAFATFGTGGFFAALAPTLVIEDLPESSPAVAGDIVCEFFLISAAAVVLTRRFRSRTAMLGGLALLVPCLALLVLAQELRSLPVLMAATAVGGFAAAMGYRGSLQTVNRITPDERRSEVISSYLVMCYLGNSLPVIGVGILSRIVGPDTAHITFAVIVACSALASFAAGLRLTRQPTDK